MPSLDALHLPLTENRLFSERSIHAAFIPLGVSLPAFRALLRALGVPYIQIGEQRFIDALTLGIALRAVSRLGRKPFVAPGTRLKRKKWNTSKFSYKLDPAYVALNLIPILHELSAARTLSWKVTSQKLHFDIQRCAKNLAVGLWAKPPTEADDQAAFDRQLLLHKTPPRTRQRKPGNAG